MTNRNRQYLKQVFGDGEAPKGENFADFVDSGLNKVDDGVDMGEDSTLVLSRGMQLGDSAHEEAGTLRFNGGVLQYHDGSDWASLTEDEGGGSVFEDLGGGNVAYQGGNVGIGEIAGPLTSRLDVRLDPGESVRLGNAEVSSDASDGAALLKHVLSKPKGGGDDDYSMRVSADGEVRLNAPEDQAVGIWQGDKLPRLVVLPDTGQVIVGSADVVVEKGKGLYAFQVKGAAYKTDGQKEWNVVSDARVKEDVRDLDAGLEQLRHVRPVRFRFNGKAGTPKGTESVGIIGQEIEQVFPEMVQRMASSEGGDPAEEDLLVYNGSALTYVLVNAVKELASRVEALESALVDATAGDSAEA